MQTKTVVSVDFLQLGRLQLLTSRDVIFWFWVLKWSVRIFAASSSRKLSRVSPKCYSYSFIHLALRSMWSLPFNCFFNLSTFPVLNKPWEAPGKIAEQMALAPQNSSVSVPELLRCSHTRTGEAKRSLSQLRQCMFYGAGSNYIWKLSFLLPETAEKAFVCGLDSTWLDFCFRI